ncbi:P-loop containing nucleoside triphosphate hydrolase protein [Xylariaceae sp. AK1471]|nr:P-loop containing nucleoside triphosphate hydrolase protein [Xylariaceae sp. AK1471]
MEDAPAELRELNGEITRLEELKLQRPLNVVERLSLKALQKEAAKLASRETLADDEIQHDNRNDYRHKSIQDDREEIALPHRHRALDARTSSGGDNEKKRSLEFSSIPRKRLADSKRVATGLTNISKLQDDAIDDHNTRPRAALMNSKVMTRKELQKAILALDGDISLNKAEEVDIDRAARSLGLSNCRVENDKWLIEGLLQPLYSHQLLALYFMLKRECSMEGPKGGINADAMGLGKTVEALATIVMNPPDKNDLRQGRRTTLWVGPKSSHAQVRAAVRKFCREKTLSNILTYNMTALKKLHGEDLESFLQKQDFIIAGYEDLVRECPNKDLSKKGRKEDKGEITPEEFRMLYRDKLGPLMRVEFYRVILDEAHRIKNVDTQKLYPYMLFLRVPGIKTVTNFDDLFLADDEARTNGLDELLNKIMIRRNNRDTILGRPLFELPIVHREIISVTQTKHERAIYKWFSRKTRASFNQRHKAKKGKKNRMPFCLTKILRLRQLACDIRLIEYIIEQKRERSIVAMMLTALDCHKGVNPVYDMIHEWYTKKNDEESQQDEEDDICTICGNIINSLFELKGCGHTFCLRCIIEHQERQNKKYGEQLKIKCPQCQAEAPWMSFDTIAALAERLLSSQAPARLVSGRSKTTSRENGPAYLQKPKMSFESCYFTSIEENPDQPMILGSKMQTIKESIQKHLTDGPNDKLIIFDDLLYCANMIGYMLDEMKIKHGYYFGYHTQEIRNEAIKAFERDPKLKIMLISMKCGSEALNLTCANRVIIIEPWWNKCAEEQAFGRVFRLGQEKETYLTRILVNKTIEMKMFDLQNAKAITIARALKDDISGETNLSEEQIANLLGRVDYDEKGNVISVSDDEESDDDDEDSCEEDSEDEGEEEED